MPRKKAARREPTPEEEGAQILANAEKAGANYAQDQVDGSYFRDWVMDQMVEGEEMRKRDPNSVIPLETPSDAKKLARNMLQQLEWDTNRDMEQSTVLELSGTDDGDLDRCGISAKDVNDAFFSSFTESLKNPTTVHWLTDLILENLDEVRGTPKSKLAHEAKRPTARKSTSSRGTVTYPRSPSGQYVLTHDGKEVMRGTENAIWAWMHRNHSFSVDHALQYEGYRIAPVEKAGDLSETSAGAKNFIAVEFDLARGERTGKRMEFLAVNIKDAAEKLVYTLNLSSSGWRVSPSGRTVQKKTGNIGWHIVEAGSNAARTMGVSEPRHPVVRDYVAVDHRGRTVAGPFTDYNEAKREADRARGYVKLASPHKTREAQGHKSSSAHAALRRATVDDLGIELRHDEDGRYRWYESETGVDTETSGKTILDAIRAARDSWPAPTWDLKFPRSHR